MEDTYLFEIATIGLYYLNFAVQSFLNLIGNNL